MYFFSCLWNNTHSLSLFSPFFISFLLSRTSALCTRGLSPLLFLAAAYPGVCVCVYTIDKVFVCDTFPKPVVIGESLQRIAAFSLVAAHSGNGGRRLVSRDGSWSRACQSLLVIAGVVLGDSSPADGRRHSSTSPWRVIPVLLGIRMALQGKSKWKEKITSRGIRETGGGSGLKGIMDKRSTPSSLTEKVKIIIIPPVIKCNPADNLMALMSDRLTNKSDNWKSRWAFWEMEGKKKRACWLSLLPPTCYTHTHTRTFAPSSSSSSSSFNSE